MATQVSNVTDATPRDVGVTLSTAELLEIYGEDFELNLVFFVVTLLGMVLGTSGNVLVIVAVLMNKKLRKLHNVFVVNLAVSDLCIAAFLNAINLVGIQSHGEYLMTSFSLCQITGLLCTFGCSGSIFSIAVIALNRYVRICHRLAYHSIYNRRTVPIFVLSPWLVGCCAEMVSWFWKGYEHNIVPQLFTCMSSLHLRFVNFGQAFAFWAAGYGFPLTVIVYCYLRIWLYARASRKALEATAGDGDPRSVVLTRTDRRLLCTLLSLVIAVVVLIGPFYAIYIFRLPVSREVLVTTFAMAHLNNCVNCVLYALTNRDFRRGYNDILSRCCRPTSRVRRTLSRRNRNIDVYVVGAGDKRDASTEQSGNVDNTHSANLPNSSSTEEANPRS